MQLLISRPSSRLTDLDRTHCAYMHVLARYIRWRHGLRATRVFPGTSLNLLYIFPFLSWVEPVSSKIYGYTVSPFSSSPSRACADIRQGSRSSCIGGSSFLATIRALPPALMHLPTYTPLEPIAASAAESCPSPTSGATLASRTQQETRTRKRRITSTRMSSPSSKRVRSSVRLGVRRSQVSSIDTLHGASYLCSGLEADVHICRMSTRPAEKNHAPPPRPSVLVRWTAEASTSCPAGGGQCCRWEHSHERRC